MSTTKTHNGFEIVESSDTYHNELHGWLPVPAFWVGDLVASHTYNIKDRTGRTKATKQLAR